MQSLCNSSSSNLETDFFKHLLDALEKEQSLKLQSLLSFVPYNRAKNVFEKLKPPCAIMSGQYEKA